MDLDISSLLMLNDVRTAEVMMVKFAEGNFKWCPRIKNIEFRTYIFLLCIVTTVVLH